MNILAITDIHGNRRRTRKLFDKYGLDVFDLIIVDGDITQFQGIDAAEEILSIISRIGRKTLFVPGNCDPPRLLDREELGGAENIHRKKVRIECEGEEIEIIGLGGSTLTPFNTWIEFSEAEILKMLPTPSLPFILVSHTPPRDTELDKTWMGRHAGSRIIREYILKERPILGLHGHIHEARGKDVLGNSTIINPGPLQGGYHAIVEIESLSDIRVEFRRV